MSTNFLRFTLFLVGLLLVVGYRSYVHKNAASLTRKSRGRQDIRMNSQEELSVADSDATIIGATGVISNIIVDYSLYVLKSTGCGLPPGPFGLEGLAEGVSYLAVVGIFGWSALTKIKTGSGLPAGPAGLLGAAEGLTYLSILGGIVIAILNYFDYGFLPGFLPNDKCFGI